MARIGVVLVTYERFSRFKESFESLIRNQDGVEEIVIVDDGSVKDKEKYDEYFSTLMFQHIHVFRNEKNQGVAAAKNRGIKYFYDAGYDYIFTVEDDINVLNSRVFQEYIDCATRTGFQYLNFALHGPLNVGQKREFKINNFPVGVYPNIVGAFTLHTRKLIDEIGLYDESFYNSMDHVEYYYRAAQKGLTSPFWLFVDIINSDKYLREQPLAIGDSSIRTNPNWQSVMVEGFKNFKKKHGVEIRDIPRP